MPTGHVCQCTSLWKFCLTCACLHCTSLLKATWVDAPRVSPVLSKPHLSDGTVVFWNLGRFSHSPTMLSPSSITLGISQFKCQACMLSQATRQRRPQDWGLCLQGRRSQLHQLHPLVQDGGIAAGMHLQVRGQISDYICCPPTLLPALVSPPALTSALLSNVQCSRHPHNSLEQ